MDQDDEPIGRLLSRREIIALLGTAGLTVMGGGILLRTGAAQGALPACIARPEQTEGPYFVDAKLNRRDLRTDPKTGAAVGGVQLDLRFNVSQVNEAACRPLPGAIVDVWQCDALGVYSDVRDMAGRFNTVGQQFLRGHQVTDTNGTAQFVTIYPGWYQGRAVHIHFKIRAAPIAGRTYEFTSQLYFDDDVTDVVTSMQPYAAKGERTVRNRQDGIFRRGGDRLLLAVEKHNTGYMSSFDIGLQIPRVG
jgi:protocatechuate 3,4-dioxygenase beta subunit